MFPHANITSCQIDKMPCGPNRHRPTSSLGIGSIIIPFVMAYSQHIDIIHFRLMVLHDFKRCLHIHCQFLIILDITYMQLGYHKWVIILKLDLGMVHLTLNWAFLKANLLLYPPQYLNSSCYKLYSPVLSHLFCEMV